MKLDVKTADKTIQLTQDHVTSMKKKKILEVKHVECVLLRNKENSWVQHGKNSYASVAQRANSISQVDKYRAFIKKLIQLEPNDWQKFQEHQKKLHSADFRQI